jgi:hypothetical protein
MMRLRCWTMLSVWVIWDEELSVPFLWSWHRICLTAMLDLLYCILDLHDAKIWTPKRHEVYVFFISDGIYTHQLL